MMTRQAAYNGQYGPSQSAMQRQMEGGGPIRSVMGATYGAGTQKRTHPYMTPGGYMGAKRAQYANGQIPAQVCKQLPVFTDSACLLQTLPAFYKLCLLFICSACVSQTLPAFCLFTDSVCFLQIACFLQTLVYICK